jgi:hypothetical protein
MREENRRVVDEYRQRDVGVVAFEAKYTFFQGAAGLALGFVWLAAFHLGDRGASAWPILALSAAGAALGLPLDLSRRRARTREQRAAAAARWDPILAVGVVEQIAAEATLAVRIDDNDANSAWFLQVDMDQVLCVWDWVDQARERVEVELIPGSSPTSLAIRWSGNELDPITPKRKFRRGEHQPEQCEVLRGRVEQLDQLLRKPGKEQPRASPKARVEGTPLAKLAEDLQPLGFYKFVFAEQIEGIKQEAHDSAHAWFVEVGRAFNADAERLAEGGVRDLLDYLRPALKVEGCELGAIAETYDAARGYTLTIGDERHTLWDQSEAAKSWELTTARAAALIDHRLEQAGSAERVHVLNGGEDAVFVLLTAALRDRIVTSGVFRPEEIPEPVATIAPAFRARD